MLTDIVNLTEDQKVSIVKELEQCSSNTTDFFGLKGHTLLCKCVDVYDGDTITVAVPIADEHRLFKVRLYGINTPEIRNKDLEQKRLGILAGNYVRDTILGKMVIVVCYKTGSFGRVLGDVYTVNSSYDKELFINQDLVEKGHAVVYRK